MDRSLRVLHLEDDARDAELVREVLEAGGIACAITRVDTREEFVASLENGGFDLILADYSLPSFDGMSALRIAAQRSPNVPYVFVSGTLGEEAAIEALKTGATDYVLKERLSGIVPSVHRALREGRERTERMRAEEAARAAKARLEDILDVALDAIISIDSSQQIILVNQGAEKVFGYAQAELIGRPLELLLPRQFADTHRTQVDEFARSAEMARRAGQRGEVHGRRKDGSEFPAEASISKVDMGGELVLTVMLRDITDRVRLEAELRRSQKMEAIGTLAGGIAHDFNNLLGAILGFSEMAQRKTRAGCAIEAELEQVVQAGQRGKRLVENILTFSRSGVGHQVPVHVQSVVREALTQLGASLPRGLRLGHRLAAGDAAVVGDATQLHQVAMNLCTNAIQAMAGVGVLTVTLDRVELAQQQTLSHGVLQPGEYVRLSVSDTGSGIPDAALARIFDPFFTTKGVGKGTGLGLSLVHGIVVDSRGAINVATKEGHGTTFTAWLPCSGETARPPAEASPELPRGNGESVLIVDDEQPLVRLAEETLAQLGYDPAGFDSPVAALEAFRAEPQRYGLVLIDQTMPALKGTDLAQEIRRLRPEVPIVLMSGYKGPHLTALARDAGVREILHKPLVSRDIADSLARVLSGQR